MNRKSDLRESKKWDSLHSRLNLVNTLKADM
jgi:hypothetical protein